jgi:hypothetical protein
MVEDIDWQKRPLCKPLHFLDRSGTSSAVIGRYIFSQSESLSWDSEPGECYERPRMSICLVRELEFTRMLKDNQVIGSPRRWTPIQTTVVCRGERL